MNNNQTPAELFGHSKAEEDYPSLVYSPCPFCAEDGDQPRRSEMMPTIDHLGWVVHATGQDPEFRGYAVCCPYCGSHGPIAGNQQDATDFWNERSEKNSDVMARDDDATPTNPKSP